MSPVKILGTIPASLNQRSNQIKLTVYALVNNSVDDIKNDKITLLIFNIQIPSVTPDRQCSFKYLNV